MFHAQGYEHVAASRRRGGFLFASRVSYGAERLTSKQPRQHCDVLQELDKTPETPCIPGFDDPAAT